MINFEMGRFWIAVEFLASELNGASAAANENDGPVPEDVRSAAIGRNAEVSVLLLEADGDDDTPSVMEPGQWFSTSVRIEIGPSLLSQTPVSREVMPGNLNGLDLETSFAMRRSRIVTRAALRKWAAMRMSVVDSILKVYGVDGFVSRTDLSSRG